MGVFNCCCPKKNKGYSYFIDNEPTKPQKKNIKKQVCFGLVFTSFVITSIVSIAIGFVALALTFIPGAKNRIFELIRLKDFENSLKYFKVLFPVASGAAGFFAINFIIAIPILFLINCCCLNRKNGKNENGKFLDIKRSSKDEHNYKKEINGINLEDSIL